MPARFVTFAVVVALTATIVSPLAGGAQEDPARESEQVAHRQALVAVEVDVLKADGVQVAQALSDIKANVDAQTAELTAAQQALAAANAAAAAADAAVADAQRRIDELLARTDGVVVDAFDNPPTESALSMLAEGSSTSANLKWAILDVRTTSDAELLAKYHAAQEQLRTEKANKDAAVAEAPARAEQLRAEQARLAAALNELDEEVAAELARLRAAELSAQAEANKAAGIQDPPGGVVSVPCPAGGSIEVAGDISKPVGRLLTAAAEAGIVLQPADGAAGRVDARAGPRHRLHGRGRHHRLRQRRLQLVEGERRQLRPVQPAERAVALVHERELTCCSLRNQRLLSEISAAAYRRRRLPVARPAEPARATAGGSGASERQRASQTAQAVGAKRPARSAAAEGGGAESLCPPHPPPGSRQSGCLGDGSCAGIGGASAGECRGAGA